LYIYTFLWDDWRLQSSNLLSEVTAMSIKVYCSLCFRLTSPSFMNSVSFWLLSNIQKTDKKIHDMTSAINEIDMEFEEIKNVNIETIGSLSQITRPCPIKYFHLHRFCNPCIYIPSYHHNHKVVICCQKWQPCLLNSNVRHVLDSLHLLKRQ
jgi:hypothetical protein